jgi:hypothetical protein
MLDGDKILQIFGTYNNGYGYMSKHFNFDDDTIKVAYGDGDGVAHFVSIHSALTGNGVSIYKEQNFLFGHSIKYHPIQQGYVNRDMELGSIEDWAQPSIISFIQHVLQNGLFEGYDIGIPYPYSY